MSNKSVFDAAFNRVQVTIQDAFYNRVEDRMTQLRNDVNDQVKEFFEDVEGSMGEEAAPAEIAGYTSWDNLTAKWRRQKAQKGKKPQRFYHPVTGKRMAGPKRTANDPNRFYKGLTGGLSRAFSGQVGKFPYGTPIITLGQGLGAGYSNTSGRVRIAKGYAGAGRFASAAGAMRATISVIPFPLISDPGDVVKPFRGKSVVKVLTGEFGDDFSGRPARPFLIPFIAYYSEKKIPDVIAGAVRP